ncbi:MAG: hypothetical protein ACI9NQ_000153 [Paracoccaceae bacterium]
MFSVSDLARWVVLATTSWPRWTFSPQIPAKTNCVRFIFIHNSRKAENSQTLNLFSHSCRKLGIEFLPINSRTFDYFEIPELGADDILYRGGTGDRAQAFEKLMINDSCRHFYSHWDHSLRGRGTTFYYHQKHGLPAIPSIPLIPWNRKEAEKFAAQLGGFPIIVKALGNSKGVGVMKVDSQEGLVSICDFLRGQGTRVILRKFIEHDHYGRLIVIGNQVVASNRCGSLDGDFRTNTSDTPNGKPFVFTKEQQQIAIDTVSVLGLKFGGVDLLFDADGNAHIAEVNFPTDFGCCQEITGIDIATLMLEFVSGLERPS